MVFCPRDHQQKRPGQKFRQLFFHSFDFLKPPIMLAIMNELVHRVAARGSGFEYIDADLDSVKVRYNGISFLFISPIERRQSIMTELGEMGLTLNEIMSTSATTVCQTNYHIEHACKKVAEQAQAQQRVCLAPNTPHSAHLSNEAVFDFVHSDDAVLIEHVSQYQQMPFECLGLPKFANDHTVIMRHKYLTVRLHPDKCNHPQVSLVLPAVNSAYQRCLQINARRKSMSIV
jgi:hypothetical protein